MKKSTKFNIANIFGSLFKNDRAISAAKTLPWWSTVIVFFVATFLPIVPIMVGIGTTNGDNFVSGLTYNLDKNITASSIALNNANVSLVVNEDHILEYKINDVLVDEASHDQNEPIYRFVNEAENQWELDIYYSFKPQTGDDSVATLINKIQGQQYICGEGYAKKDTDPVDSKYYIPSFIVFHKNGMVVGNYKHNTTVLASSYSGDWLKTAPGNIVERVLTVEGYSIPTDYKTIPNLETYIEGSFKNWKTIFVEGYESTKGNMFLYNTLIYYGVYMGLVLFLGMLVFLLTRGKKNFNNYLKWYQCIGISVWASLSPGLLSLILGFMMSQYAVMFFILFTGVRVMWLTMKQLAPAQAR